MWQRIRRFIASLQPPEYSKGTPLDLDTFLDESVGLVKLQPRISGSGQQFKVGIHLSAQSKNTGWFGHPRRVEHFFEPREYEIDGYFENIPGQGAARDEMFKKAHPFLKISYRRAGELKRSVEQSGRLAEIVLDSKLQVHLKKNNLKLT